MSDRKLSDEFQEFMVSAALMPPLRVEEAVLERVHNDLSPSQISVSLKMLGVHSVVSLFSLAICSQFGIQSLKIFDLMKLMMAVTGPSSCMAFCGVIYLGLSALTFSFLLTPEEIKVIRRHEILQLTLLAGVSLGIFLCLGAELLILPTALWIAGSVGGGVLSLELGWKVRSQLARVAAK